MDLANAYASLARLGVRTEPVFVARVLDRTGRELGRAGDTVSFEGSDARRLPGGEGTRVMPTWAAYEVVEMMRNVFYEGTAKKGQRPGMDFAGKTGTTSGFVDAWFVGFSPRYTVAVWIGTDGTQSIGDKETGGKAALPTWSTIMEALPNLEGERFPLPPDVVLVPEDRRWMAVRRGAAPRDVLVPLVDPGEAPLPPFGGSLPTAQPPPAPP
jgi:penicillin-binding protein 1A